MQGKRPPHPPVIFPEQLSKIDIPDPPSSLKSDLEKKMWAEIVYVMMKNRTYGEDCCQTVVAYCVQLARFWEAETQIRNNGMVTKITKAKHVVNPWIAISNQ